MSVASGPVASGSSTTVVGTPPESISAEQSPSNSKDDRKLSPLPQADTILETDTYHQRSTLAPEVLQAYAEQHKNIDASDLPGKVRVITEKQFEKDYKNQLSRKGTGFRPITPVVFAVPSMYAGAGRKVVDYYYSFVGKKGTKSLKGSKRKDFLEAEFERIDRMAVTGRDNPVEIERMNSLGRPSHDNFSRRTTMEKTPEPASETPLPPQERHTPTIIVRPPVRPSSHETGSTMSLPFVGMIQVDEDGANISNKMYLRAVNPDNLSASTTESEKRRRKTKSSRSSPLAQHARIPARTPSVSSSDTLIENESSHGHHHRVHTTSPTAKVTSEAGTSEHKSRHRKHSHRKKDKDSVSVSSSRRHTSSSSTSSSRHKGPTAVRRTHSADLPSTHEDDEEEQPLTIVLMDEDHTHHTSWHNIDHGRLAREAGPVPPTEHVRHSPWAMSQTHSLPSLSRHPSPVTPHHAYGSSSSSDDDSDDDSNSDWDDSDRDRPPFQPFPPHLAHEMFRRQSTHSHSPVQPFLPNLARTLERHTPQTRDDTPLPHVYSPHIYYQPPPQQQQHTPRPANYSPFPSLHYLPMQSSPYVATTNLYNGGTVYSSRPHTPVGGYLPHIYADYPPSSGSPYA